MQSPRHPNPKSRNRVHGSAPSVAHEPLEIMANFPVKEKLASRQGIAVTSELEAKLQQRMLKCEGKDTLYKPRASRFIDPPSWTPARLKLISVTRDSEYGAAPKVESPSEVGEPELAASYQQRTKEGSRTRPRKRSSPHPRREAEPQKYMFSPEAAFPMTGTLQDTCPERASRAGKRSQRRRSRPSAPRSPPAAATPRASSSMASEDNQPLSSVENEDEEQDVGGQETQGHGVPMFALDDPERDVAEESRRTSMSSRSSETPETFDLGGEANQDTSDQDVSIEDCLFDLVNHVPPKMAGKIGALLQRLESLQLSDVAPAQSTDDTPSPQPKSQTPWTDLHQPRDPHNVSLPLQEQVTPRLVQLEGKANDAEEWARHCASELLQEREERAVWFEELAESRACSTRLEQQGRVAESRAEVNASRMVAEVELLHTRLLGEQAQVHGLRARLEEAEWQCSRQLQEKRVSSNEVIALRRRAAEMERLVQETQQEGHLRHEELSLQHGCAAESQQVAQVTPKLKEVQAMAAPKEKRLPEAQWAQWVGSTSAEDSCELGDATMEQTLQGDGGTFPLRASPGRRGTQVASQASKAAERELRSELASALAEVDRQNRLRKAANELKEQSCSEQKQTAADLEKAVSEGVALRSELRAEQEAVEKTRGQLRHALLKGPACDSHSQAGKAGQAPQTGPAPVGHAHEKRDKGARAAGKGDAEVELAQRLARLYEDRQRRCRNDSEQAGLAAERQAMNGWMAATSADCLRAREQEAHLAGELARTRSRLEQEEHQLEEERFERLELACEAQELEHPERKEQEAYVSSERWAAATVEQWLQHGGGAVNSHSSSSSCSRSRSSSPSPGLSADLPDLGQRPAAPEPVSKTPGAKRRDLNLKQRRQQLLSRSQEMLQLEQSSRAVSLEMAAQIQALERSQAQRWQLSSQTQLTVLEAAELRRLLDERSVAQEKELWHTEVLRDRLVEEEVEASHAAAEAPATADS